MLMSFDNRAIAHPYVLAQYLDNEGVVCLLPLIVVQAKIDGPGYLVYNLY